MLIWRTFVVSLAFVWRSAALSHGRLISPTPGTTYYLAKNDLIHILYQRVAQTVDISLNMNALNDTYFGVPFPLLAGLQSCNSGEDEYIDAKVLLPNGFCGDYSLAIAEHQNNGQTVTTASPTIHIICPPPVLPLDRRTQLAERAVLPQLLLPRNNSHYVNNNGLGSSIEIVVSGDGQSTGFNTEVEGNEQLYHLTLGLADTACTAPGLPVWTAFFSPPVGACGTYNLFVDVSENDGEDNMVSNAPFLKFTCPT